MSLLEALKGARVELAAIPSPIGKLHRLIGITRTFAEEIVGQLLLAPYAVRALRTYRSLPRLECSAYDRPDGVSIMKDLSYGRQSRNVVDVYVPPGSPDGVGPDGKGGMPVALFCHGGVWAVGDKWQYAPMATRLAAAGVLTVVMHYSLFPRALVPEMVDEVSAALSWTLEHCSALGGDPSRVSLVGHSAGAQLAMMALLHRTQRGGLQNGRKQQQVVQQQEGIPSLLYSMDAWQQDGRMPKRLVGMAGVYDLTKHFSYETQRSVQELSTMKRAAGGEARFPSVSPAVIVARALREAATTNGGSIKSHRGSRRSSASNGNGNSKADSSRKGVALQGEALAHRIGFERPRASMAERLAAVIGPEAEGSSCDGNGSNGSTLRLSLREARRLPPTVLMSSCADKTVPWYESAEMFWMLHDCGVPVKHLVEPFAGHGDYVTSWAGRHSNAGGSKEGTDTGADLPSVARDLLLIVSEQMEPAWANVDCQDDVLVS